MHACMRPFSRGGPADSDGGSAGPPRHCGTQWQPEAGTSSLSRALAAWDRHWQTGKGAHWSTAQKGRALVLVLAERPVMIRHLMRPAPEMRPGGTLKSARNLARGLACPAQRLTKDPHAPHARHRALDPLRLREPATRARSGLRVRDPPLPRYCRVCTRERHAAHSSERACRNPHERPRAIAHSSRRSRLPAAAALLCVRELRRELSARSSSSRRSPRLQPARSRLPLASVHFEQQLDRTLVLPPMALL